ncbi:hypothetical protein RIF29_36358 [Crotalaria pallida]|uniref:J domain-containing protein n=1 Tax=Crotalaria pallida TaxID=3830 RepID=A0AAN9EB11_CROPI
MDPLQGPGSEPDNLIAACTTILSYRRFPTCRDFALKAPRSDPITSASLDKILAISDVLSAAEHRLPSNHPDYYSILLLPREDAARDRDLLTRQFKKLALLLDPTSATKFPFSDEALNWVREAWRVLSDPKSRDLYHAQIGYLPPNATFWTACPYCWNLFEYETRFEDCSLMCQSCGKTFHGVAVTPPVKEDKEYYWCQTNLPLKYKEKEEEKNDDDNNKTNIEKTGFDQTQFVYISDDDHDHVVVGGEKNVGEGVWGDMNLNLNARAAPVDLQQGSDNGKRKMRMKTVAKKSGGNRMRNDFDLDLDLDLDEDGDLEFTEGDGDVFVGVRFDD